MTYIMKYINGYIFRQALKKVIVPEMRAKKKTKTDRPTKKRETQNSASIMYTETNATSTGIQRVTSELHSASTMINRVEESHNLNSPQ